PDRGAAPPVDHPPSLSARPGRQHAGVAPAWTPAPARERSHTPLLAAAVAVLWCLLPAVPGLGRLFRLLGGHAGAMTVRSVGVEEELLLVEPQTGQPRAVAGTVLQAAQAAAESGDSAG